MVELQAFLTLVGNITCAIAAYRIAASNGWTFGELNPFRKGGSLETIVINEVAALPFNVVAAQDSELLLAAKSITL